MNEKIRKILGNYAENREMLKNFVENVSDGVVIDDKVEID
jgi:hypothetical protein